MSKRPERILSLLPAATEILAALGLEDRMVGRSHECDAPVSVRRLPVCTRSRVDGSVSSRAIDDQFRTILSQQSGEAAQELSIYEIDPQRLAALKPDLIVTRTQSHLWAVKPRQVSEAVGRLTGHPPQIVSLNARTLEGVWDDIRRIGEAAGADEEADELVAALHAEADELAASVADFPDRPRVACLEWIDPLLSSGQWIPQLVELAGGVDVFGQAGQSGRWLEWSELVEADPDVLVLIPCNFPLARGRREAQVLQAHPSWPQLQAVAQGRVFVADGRHYFNRPGPRLIDSACALAEMLHPGLSPALEAQAWHRLGAAVAA